MEQFNLRSTKQIADSSLAQSVNVEITAPIVNNQEIALNGLTPLSGAPLNSHVTSPSAHVTISTPSPPPSESLWKNSPLYNTDSSGDEDVPELIRRLSHGAIPNLPRSSDTISSDIIVNSISNGR